MQDKIRVYELDPTRGVSTRPRSKKYISNDAAIKQLVQNLTKILIQLMNKLLHIYDLSNID